ncbi:MAG TPA: hypothetical protein VFJ90_11275, partial [Candidatus Didemnitutus sp.]|nr:hypothetical protein [Candidatus Didemnitutus sp.]
MTAHASTIREHPEELRTLTHAWFRALQWWQAHPTEGNAMVERRLKLATGSVSTAGIRLLSQEDNRISFSGDADKCSLHQAVLAYVEFFVTRGELSRRLASTELLDARFVR